MDLSNVNDNFYNIVEDRIIEEHKAVESEQLRFRYESFKIKNQ
jgi:hypothetical protein